MSAPACSCASPAYPPPTSTDASLAPHDLGLDGGCLHPLSASLSRVTDNVLLTLTKTATAAEQRSINVTLSVDGSDYRAGAYAWHVDEAAALPEWLEVLAPSGNVSKPDVGARATATVPIRVSPRVLAEGEHTSTLTLAPTPPTGP